MQLTHFPKGRNDRSKHPNAAQTSFGHCEEEVLLLSTPGTRASKYNGSGRDVPRRARRIRASARARTSPQRSREQSTVPARSPARSHSFPQDRDRLRAPPLNGGPARHGAHCQETINAAHPPDRRRARRGIQVPGWPGVARAEHRRPATGARAHEEASRESWRRRGQPHLDPERTWRRLPDYPPPGAA